MPRRTLRRFTTPLRRLARTELSFPRSRDSCHRCGRLCLHRKRINISIVLAGQKLGIKEVDEGIWLASFMHYDLILRPGAENFATPRQPVRPEVVTHVLGTICYPCLRAGHSKTGAARGIRTPDPVITNDVLYQLSYCGKPL
jgi:hypothetical protein